MVYAVELAQTILYTKMAFQEFAAGFGNILALEKIGLLWFAAPILTAIGMSLFISLGHSRNSLAYKEISLVPGPNILCMANQNINRIILHLNCRYFGKKNSVPLKMVFFSFLPA